MGVLWVGAPSVRVVALLLGVLTPAVSAAEPAPGHAPSESAGAALPGSADVVLPRAIATDVSYPAGAEGEQRVVLELLISASGAVEGVTVVSGAEPFGSAATKAAERWRFVPAFRGEAPVASKIRFSVLFTPPKEDLPSANHAGKAQPPAVLSEESSIDVISAESKPGTERGVIEVVVLGEINAAPRERLGREEVRQLPGAFGDAFRAIEVLPGVVPIAGGLPYFYVRGAPPGNVGYFFDGIRVPTLYHFALGPAVLHPAFVGNVDLYAGAYPADYGRYAGGIVVGELSAPTLELRGEANVRLIDSGAMLEVPFAEGRGNAMFGGRYSYTALVISLLVPEVSLRYWDYQTRVRYSLDTNDDVEVFAFGSGDAFSEEPDERGGETELFELGFHRVDLRWDHTLPRGRLRQALTWGFDATRSGQELEMRAIMVGARSEADLTLSTTRRISAGVDVVFESFAQHFRTAAERQAAIANSLDDPGAPVELPDRVAPPNSSQVVAGGASTDPPSPDEVEFDFGPRRELTVGGHAGLAWDAAPGVRFTPGLRVDGFFSGPDFALGIDPRLAARYRLTEDLDAIHAVGIVHQAPSFPVPIPGVKPSLKGGLQRAVQSSAGVEARLPWHVRGSLTLFQNVFFNLTDLIGTSRELSGYDYRSTGHAVGAEVLLKRDLAQRLGGLLSYTLVRSTRSLGTYIGPADFDRTHVLNLALTYNLGANWRFGNRFTFYTGIPPRIDSELSPEPTPGRTRPFWRLDWRLEKRWVWSEAQRISLVLEVLNTTMNEEVTSLTCQDDECFEATIGPVTLPSVGVEAAF